MSLPLKIGASALLVGLSLGCLLLGALAVANPLDRTGKASHLFFSLAALSLGLAAGVLVFL